MYEGNELTNAELGGGYRTPWDQIGAKPIHSREEFMDTLEEMDGEAKWFTQGGQLFMVSTETELSPHFPNWDYAFSDEPDSIDFKQMGI